MWDKKRGEHKYDERNKVLWLGPYIVKKKSEQGKCYLSTMKGRRMPLPVSNPTSKELDLFRAQAPGK
jgi:hypothetical protein